jgi:uncharacterized protein (DUF433 family)
MTTELMERIVVNPAICFGKPTIRGHRIWVSLVLGYLAEGWTPEQVVEEFTGLVIDDVRACIAYGACRRSPLDREPRTDSRVDAEH